MCWRMVATYLGVEVADVHGPPDLVDFRRVDVAHEGRLGRDRGCEVQTGGHPVHYGEVQLKKTPAGSPGFKSTTSFPYIPFFWLKFLELSYNVSVGFF